MLSGSRLETVHHRSGAKRLMQERFLLLNDADCLMRDAETSAVLR